MKEDLSSLVGQVRRQIALCAELGMPPPPMRRSVSPERRREAVLPGAKGPDAVSALEALRERIGECTRCKLHRQRRHLVFGEGPVGATVLFVGEAPGAEEDRLGRPFVGEAGELLTRIIENGMGLKRRDVYICNVVKCRPPRNRDPEADEIATCLPFLKEQIGIVGPKVICTLGRVAGRALLGEGFQTTVARGRWQTYDGVPLMPTYHPGYLLRNPAAKRKVWEDIKKVMKHLGLEIRQESKD